MEKITLHNLSRKTHLFYTLFIMIITLLLVIITATNRGNLREIKKELRMVDLKASASIRASKDLNYFGRIVLKLDQLTKHKIPQRDLTEIAHMIYAAEKMLYPVCGYDSAIAIAHIQAESDGELRAVSQTSDRGIWQLHDSTGIRIFKTIGYGTANYFKDVFDPLKNTRGALYHIQKELYPYWIEKTKDKTLLLMMIIHSYRWGSKATEQLVSSFGRDRMPGFAYTKKILNNAVKIREQLNEGG